MILSRPPAKNILDDLSDFQCGVCKTFCIEAVEAECCASLFCKQCISKSIQAYQPCPTCHNPNPTIRPSPFINKVIGKIRVTCSNSGCSVTFLISETPTHTLQCKFAVVKCRHCKQSIPQDSLTNHFIQKHRQETTKLLLKDYELPTNKSSIKLASRKVSDPLQDYNPLATVVNSKGRQAKLGENSKYYCGGELGTKCDCCDGYCGPTNGENCPGCMELDLKVRGIKKGYLINTRGNIAKVEDGVVHCGVLTDLGKYNMFMCTTKSLCTACKSSSQTLDRYKSVYE